MRRPTASQVSICASLTLLNVFAAASGYRDLENPWLWVIVLGMWPGLLGVACLLEKRHEN